VPKQEKTNSPNYAGAEIDTVCAIAASSCCTVHMLWGGVLHDV